MVSPGGHIFRTVDLQHNPFEAQGEFDPSVSLAVKKFRNDQIKDCRDLIEKAAAERKIQVAVIWGPPGSGKTHLIHRLAQSEAFSSATKHIVLKMSIGSADDPLFMLALIVGKLADVASTLPRNEVEAFKDSLSNDFPEFKKTEVVLPAEESRKASRLLNEWFLNVKTIVEVGHFRSVAIYVDEVEDRWTSSSMTIIQRENDLKLLRDLIGFVQEEKQIAGDFPVALFLSMTTETYHQIGKENSALQSRLSRIIALPAWTEVEAKQLVEERIKAARLPNSRSGNAEPFSYEAIDEIASACRRPISFDLRRFLILMSDYLFVFARNRLIETSGPSVMARAAVREWIGRRKDAYEKLDAAKPSGQSPTSTLQSAPQKQDIFDLAITKNPEAQTKWMRLKNALEGNEDAQFDRCLQNVVRLLREISPDLIDLGDLPNTGQIKISGQEGVVPVKVVAEEGADPNWNGFHICATLDSISKQRPGWFFMKLPRDKLLQFSLINEPGILADPEVKLLAETLKDDAGKFLTSVTTFFKENKRTRYMPHVIPLSASKRKELLEGLVEMRTKGSVKAQMKGKLIDADLADGARIKDPYWMPLLLQSADLDTPEIIRNRVFDLNRDSEPIKAAIALLQELSMLKGTQRVTVKSVREDIEALIANETKSVKDWSDQVQVQNEGSKLDWVESMAKDQVKSFKEIHTALNKFGEDPSCEIASYVDLYSVRLRAQAFTRDAESKRSAILDSFEKYSGLQHAITQRQKELAKCRFKDNSLLDKLREIGKAIEKAISEGRTDELVTLDEDLHKLNEAVGTAIRMNQEFDRRYERIKPNVMISAIRFGYDRMTEANWEKSLGRLSKATSYHDAVEALEELELSWADLKLASERRRSELAQRFENTSRALARVQSLLEPKVTKDAEEELRGFRVQWGSVDKEYLSGDFSVVFDNKLDERLRVVAEALVKVLDPTKVYVVDDLSDAFGLDPGQAMDVAEILTRLGILERAYRVSRVR